MLKDRLIFVSLLAAAVSNIILWVALGGKFGWSVEKIPLHFNVIYGIDLVAESRLLYVMPLIGAFLLGLNAGLASFLYPQNKLQSYFLCFAALLLQIVLLLGVFVIIVLNVQ